MAKIGLRGIIDESFVLRFAGLSSSQSSASSITQAFQGGASQNGIQEGLRLGARTFAGAVQSLNSVITVVSVSQAALDNLDKLTDKMIALAEESSLGTTSSGKRSDLNIRYHDLANDFEEIVENAKIGDTEVLTVEGLSELFTRFGLDRESSESIAAVFEEIVTPREDDTLASGEIKGERPVNIPASAFDVPRPVSRVTVEFDNLFDQATNISTRPNAFRVLNDLKALKEQITDNRAALENAQTVIGQNLDLVRAAGFAFLELSDQISSETSADDVASLLRDRIRKDAPAALAQAENLESIVVAALAVDPKSLV